jgi:hypothetical protein
MLKYSAYKGSEGYDEFILLGSSEGLAVRAALSVTTTRENPTEFVNGVRKMLLEEVAACGVLAV